MPSDSRAAVREQGMTPGTTLARLVLIGVVLPVVAGLFAYTGGWLSPHRLSPARLMGAFQDDNGPHPGFRRNHAKGMCVAGWFQSSGAALSPLQRAGFSAEPVPVVGRFALAGGMPAQSDAPATVRSMALRFLPPGGGEWRRRAPLPPAGSGRRRPIMNAQQARFTAFSRLLHWLMAIMVLTMLFIGVGMVSTETPRYWTLVSIHKPLGIAIFVLVIVRFINRQLNPPPPLPSTIPRWQRLAAEGSHYVLYTLMFVMPLVGWGMLSAEPYPVVLFGSVHLPPILPQNAALYAWPAAGAYLPGLPVLRHLHGAFRGRAAARAHPARWGFRKYGSLIRMLPSGALTIVAWAAFVYALLFGIRYLLGARIYLTCGLRQVEVRPLPRQNIEPDELRLLSLLDDELLAAASGTWASARPLHF